MPPFAMEKGTGKRFVWRIAFRFAIWKGLASWLRKALS